MATTNYTIYVINQSTNSQLFWAFLAEPQVTNNPQVFANSNTNLMVPAGSTNLNSFTIPVQYIVGAGASNNAVGLNTRIESNATRNSELNQLWDVTYATVPPNQGPIIPTSASGGSTATTLAMKTNGYNPAINSASNWFESMSFGIRTSQGFMGLTWNPQPSKTFTITPKLTFYIAVGDYSNNSLADINSVSNSSAVCDVPTSFDAINQCTVTYSTTGAWDVKPGRPSEALLLTPAKTLAGSHYA